MRAIASVAALLLSATPASANSGCSDVDLGVKASTKISVCSGNTVRVSHTPQGGAPKAESLVVKDTWSPANYKVTNGTDSLTITTDSLQIVYSYGTDTVGFRNSAGDVILQESQHSLTPSTTVQGLYEVSQTWKTESSEGIYGGGQYQNGLINWAGTPLSMIQFNNQAVVPFFMSTKGYGILWDSYSWTHLNDGTEVPLKRLSNVTSVSASSMKLNAGVHNFQVRLSQGPWSVGGTYSLRVNITNTATGKVMTGQSWEDLRNIPESMIARFDIPSDGTYDVSVEYDGSYDETLYHNSELASESLKLRSEATESVDYYFMWGGENSMDGAVAAYREASGASYLYGKYAYGFWQCKNRYHNQSELTNAALEFRQRAIPVDNIVQDWRYWGTLGWGPHWDPSIYPKPAELVSTLHENNFHFMVSVWGKFDQKTDFFTQLNESGYIINGSIYYDPYNPSAREMYYNFSNDNHFKIGVDALWLDATEPEALPNYNHKVFLGSGTQYANPYSLMTTAAVADGLRKDYPTTTGARVFSLTRSSFAGQQRTGAALWSGDITSTWDILRRQIAASINYQMSGIPYWSEDIGGFFRPKDMYTSMDYWCMLTRWFQFGVFTPIFRVHGTANTELWNYGPYVQRWVVDSAINLRYRMLPYIYSGFRRVEQEGYTMQRGMPFDFPEDPEVRDMGDQFMFGESLLIAPIYSPNNTNSDLATRSVYLPQGGWWDFNSGSKKSPGHQGYSVNILQTPIFVRDGTVLVMGPKVQHTGEKTDPLEIRIFGDSAATFTLYEDDGKSPSMEAGHQFSEIVFSFKDGSLTVSDRKGSFPGMLASRTLNIVKVREGHGAGVDATANPDKTVTYTGAAVTIPIPQK